MNAHTQDCSCYKCHFDRTQPAPHAALIAVLTAIMFMEHETVKTCPLCGGTSKDDCAENDCDNDWTDFWIPEDPAPDCSGCGAMTRARCRCGSMQSCDGEAYGD